MITAYAILAQNGTVAALSSNAIGTEGFPPDMRVVELVDRASILRKFDAYVPADQVASLRWRIIELEDKLREIASMSPAIAGAARMAAKDALERAPLTPRPAGDGTAAAATKARATLAGYTHAAREFAPGLRVLPSRVVMREIDAVEAAGRLSELWPPSFSDHPADILGHLGAPAAIVEQARAICDAPQSAALGENGVPGCPGKKPRGFAIVGTCERGCRNLEYGCKARREGMPPACGLPGDEAPEDLGEDETDGQPSPGTSFAGGIVNFDADTFKLTLFNASGRPESGGYRAEITITTDPAEIARAFESDDERRTR